MAAFQIAINDFGVMLEVESDYAHGIAQVDALNAGEEFDFLIIADANMFMAAAKPTVQSYRLLMPCFMQTQYIVTNPTMYSYDARRLWFANASTGEAQFKMKTPDIKQYIREKPNTLEISDVQNKFLELDRGEAIISWEPIISVHGNNRPDLIVTPSNGYKVTTSMYCNKSFNSPSTMQIRSALQEVLIAAWNKARLEPLTAHLRMLQNSELRKEYVSSVGTEIS
ncbi:MAG: hypothetical protein DIZ78_13915 [endosymbiont of Escarpia spicata]|uniref:Uncharacterized protein n=1 Tax=endosymbiont of Escarpia spicata TaxID=2200908 RepID=A0A370DH04_9GAMM|nr:MAG: hypothetical protein DIZ78_13915 [endosymbiont of Escarpia spicata]